MSGHGEDPEAYAVRWAQRYLKRSMELQWTKWHWATDGSFTACGRPIILGGCDEGPMFPETDERWEVVTCRKCQHAVRHEGDSGPLRGLVELG